MKEKSDLYYRFIFSGIAICLVGLLIRFAYHPLIQVLLIFLITLLTGVGVWEYAQLARNKSIPPMTRMMIFVAIIQVMAFYISLAYPLSSQFSLLIIVFGFLSFFVAHFRNLENVLLRVAVAFFAICYIAIPFSFMLAILYPKSETSDGRWWLVYLIAVTKITDIGGYLIGKLFGKHPLAPCLSPKKTIEGGVGGLCFAILSSISMAILGKQFGWDLSFWNAIWLAVVLGLLAQLGDLGESALKRDACMKDSNTFPGVGGVLDMVDSLLFTSPVLYYFIRIL